MAKIHLVTVVTPFVRLRRSSEGFAMSIGFRKIYFHRFFAVLLMPKNGELAPLC
ncbi:MAG: hypothetical protein ACK52Z_04385 [Acidobacteriota bacterium]